MPWLWPWLQRLRLLLGDGVRRSVAGRSPATKMTGRTPGLLDDEPKQLDVAEEPLGRMASTSR